MSEKESLAAEIHRVYCTAYEKRFGKPYFTNGDYNLLEEPVKDYDRALADFIIEREKRFTAFKALVREYRKTQKELYEHGTFTLHTNLTGLGKLIDEELGR